MLTSKERVLIALNHKEPDRVPIGYHASKEVNDILKKYFNTNNDNVVLEKLNIDLRIVQPKYIGPSDRSYDEVWPLGKDIWGVVRKFVNNKYGKYSEIVYYPLKNVSTIEELENYNWPSIEWFDFESIKKQIDDFNYKNEYFVVMYFSGSIFEHSWYMRGMEQFLFDMLFNPEIASKIIEKVFNFWFKFNQECFRISKNNIDMARFSDDFGGQLNMLISPDLFNNFFKKYYIKFFNLCHENNIKTYFHSCGSIEQIIPDLIDIGLDVLNPLQFSAHGFPDPKTLKTKYGKKLSFEGGMDVQKILPFLTSEELKSYTYKLIKILGKDGGFIVEPSHAIQPDVKLENIISFYNAAFNFKY